MNNLIVKKSEIDSAFLKIDKQVIKSLKHSIKRVKSYHKKQLPKNDLYKDETWNFTWRYLESN